MKNHSWEDMTVLRGRMRLVTNISITFFKENDVLSIFHLTIFSKKKHNIFQNNHEKKFFGDIKKHELDDKNEYNLLYGI